MNPWDNTLRAHLSGPTVGSIPLTVSRSMTETDREGRAVIRCVTDDGEYVTIALPLRDLQAIVHAQAPLAQPHRTEFWVRFEQEPTVGQNRSPVKPNGDTSEASATGS